MITVMIADDENLIRDALGSLLSLEEDIEVIAHAATGNEALAQAAKHRPDVALLDLQMPAPDGIEVARALADSLPDCACVVVTSHGLPGHLKNALTVGVRGFLPKTVSSTTLAQVVRTVAAGGRYVDPELAADAIGAGDSPLTAREADVLAMADDGRPVDQIAQRVSLSPGTVRNYLSAAVTKLGVTNRHEAVRLARQRGWI
ncbi:response regulator transcription factor [Propionibacteriaceae bacterium Y1685]|uniref:response regulator transcription factor n=1 Tax=Microlunatus sp. Y1700 TaxID=3418487 RepID=UPI003B764F38